MHPQSTGVEHGVRLSRAGIVLALVALAALRSGSAAAWYDCLWAFRTEVTVSENSGGTLSSYQVPIQITASDFHSDYVWSADGADLRVIDSDDATELDFFIESWNALSETALVWVRFPTLAANSNRLIYFYYGNSSASTVSTGFTFTNPGIRFHTRNSTTNPANKSQAFNAFDVAGDGVPGFGCRFITNFTGVTNANQFSPPSQNGNFIALSESFFEVRPGEEGVWGFRYGGDFGRGGALYVDDVALEEQWVDDLWWAYNWGASGDVLEGTISLAAGYHKLEVIGAEGCCDGGITVQYRRPGGAYQTFQTSSIDVRSRECPVEDPTSSWGSQGLRAPELSIEKTVQTIEDPINGGSNPKAIPGARMRYSVAVSNLGEGTSDVDGIVVDDEIPQNTRLYLAGSLPIQFVDGAPSSSLSFDYGGLTSTTDDIEFSDDGGASYGYAPTIDADGADANVTHIRITPTGRLSCGSPTDPPSFTAEFDVLLD